MRKQHRGNISFSFQSYNAQMKQRFLFFFSPFLYSICFYADANRHPIAASFERPTPADLTLFSIQLEGYNASYRYNIFTKKKRLEKGKMKNSEKRKKTTKQKNNVKQKWRRHLKRNTRRKTRHNTQRQKCEDFSWIFFFFRYRFSWLRVGGGDEANATTKR